MNEYDLLDAAWRRWQSGEVTERGPFPEIGDAYRLENGIGLGEKITPPGHVAFCAYCGRSLSEVQWYWQVGQEWRPIGPECRKHHPWRKIRKKDAESD
jgi:hypothetical protein